MLNKKILEKISKQIKEILPPAALDAKESIDENIKQILESAFAKLNLVTREEFDVQVEVLKRTRAKLEALEEKLEKLNPKDN